MITCEVPFQFLAGRSIQAVSVDYITPVLKIILK